MSICFKGEWKFTREKWEVMGERLGVDQCWIHVYQVGPGDGPARVTWGGRVGRPGERDSDLWITIILAVLWWSISMTTFTGGHWSLPTQRDGQCRREARGGIWRGRGRLERSGLGEKAMRFSFQTTYDSIIQRVWKFSDFSLISDFFTWAILKIIFEISI